MCSYFTNGSTGNFDLEPEDLENERMGRIRAIVVVYKSSILAQLHYSNSLELEQTFKKTLTQLIYPKLAYA